MNSRMLEFKCHAQPKEIYWSDLFSASRYNGIKQDFNSFFFVYSRIKVRCGSGETCGNRWKNFSMVVD